MLTAEPRGIVYFLLSGLQKLGLRFSRQSRLYAKSSHSCYCYRRCLVTLDQVLAWNQLGDLYSPCLPSVYFLEAFAGSTVLSALSLVPMVDVHRRTYLNEQYTRLSNFLSLEAQLSAEHLLDIPEFYRLSIVKKAQPFFESEY